MYPTNEYRIRELKEIIARAEEELRQLEWGDGGVTPHNRPNKQAMACSMPQGHPSHCGCEWVNWGQGR